MDIEKEVRRMARDLLRRNPLRRGPFIWGDDELRKIAFGSQREEPMATLNDLVAAEADCKRLEAECVRLSFESFFGKGNFKC